MFYHANINVWKVTLCNFHIEMNIESIHNKGRPHALATG